MGTTRRTRSNRAYSRKIVRNYRVKLCDVCGAPTELVHSTQVYGRSVGKWDWYILCTNQQCRASVETVEGTSRPRKRMATPLNRRARIDAHRVFDKLWQTKDQRNRAYAWLAEKMGMERKDCHIGLFDTEQCQKAIRLILYYKPVIAADKEINNRFERTKKNDK